MNKQQYLAVPTPEETTYTFNWNQESKYHQALKKAYEDITENITISENVLNMTGMSGKYYRSFINNLIRYVDDSRYLEVGSWAGSTACAAMYHNSCTVICIDNWSQFGGPKESFFRNIESNIKFTEKVGKKVNFNFLEEDFYKVDFKNLNKSNIYLFDGPHSKQDHYNGIALAQDALDDIYIQIVDDWNYTSIQNGTLEAFKDLNLTILESIEIKTNLNSKNGSPSGPTTQWHNGCFVAVIKK